MAILDTITRDDVYVIFVEAVNKIVSLFLQISRGSARACERVSGVLLDGPREKRDCS